MQKSSIEKKFKPMGEWTGSYSLIEMIDFKEEACFDLLQLFIQALYEEMDDQVQNMFDLSNGDGFSLPEPYFHEESEYSYQQEENSKHQGGLEKQLEEKAEPKTTDISYFVNIEPSKPEPPIVLLPQKIEVTLQRTLSQNITRAKKGSKDDTVLLNINFKTIFVGLFREKMFLNELSPEDVRHIEQFNKRSPSFKSLAQFCNPPNKSSVILQELKRFINSSLILKRILDSRCLLETKFQMIKFIQILRKNVLGRGVIIKWKKLAKK